jgi:hypothetical protein
MSRSATLDTLDELLLKTPEIDADPHFFLDSASVGTSSMSTRARFRRAPAVIDLQAFADDNEIAVNLTLGHGPIETLTGAVRRPLDPTYGDFGWNLPLTIGKAKKRVQNKGIILGGLGRIGGKVKRKVEKTVEGFLQR